MFCRGYEVESWLRFWTRLWILSLVEMLMFGWNFEVDAWSRFWRWNLIKICVWIRDMTSRSYFGKMNSILGSVVPLAMFYFIFRCSPSVRSTHNLYVYFFYILLLVLRDTFMASKYRYYDFLQRSHNGMHVISDSFTRSWVVKHFLFSLLLFSSRRLQHLALGREGTSNNSCLVNWWTSW